VNHAIRDEGRGPGQQHHIRHPIEHSGGEGNGGDNLTVVDAGIDPGAGLALHIHPNYEEAMLVVEGNIEAVLADETRILGPGDLLLAPAGVKHTITNHSDKPARVLAIYPTTTPERVFV